MKISLATIRLLGMFAILDLYFSKKRSPLLIIVATGWLVYAISPLAYIYSISIPILSFVSGVSGLLGTYLIFMGIISYFFSIKAERIWHGFAFTILAVFILYFIGFSNNVLYISIISGQMLILLVTSILGISRWKKFRLISSTGTLWLISILVFGILLCIGFLFFPPGETPVVFGLVHLLISLSVLIYFLNMEYNLSYYVTKEHENKLAAIFNSSPNAIIITKISGDIISCNIAAVDMYHCTSEKDVIGRNVKEFFLSSDEISLGHYLEKLLKEGIVKDFEFTGLDTNGRQFPVRISTGIVKNIMDKPEYLVSISRDISDEIAAEKKIKYSLKEKDILLEEINSRVKNNLTLISSILGLQLLDNDNSKIEDIIIKSQQRINSMALIHEKLYESKNFNNMDIEEYIKRLINYLVDQYGFIGQQIKFELDIEKITMNLDSLIPFGLILNEIITNTLVHGFTETEKPLIMVELRLNNNIVNLSLCDNGSGIPGSNVLKNKHSLGLLLIESLTKQLHGNSSFNGESGTCWKLTFPDKIK